MFVGMAMEWWDKLSIEEKVKYKKGFELFRKMDKHNYPNMYDLRHIRISQLSPKQITRIHTFRDRIENLNQ